MDRRSTRKASRGLNLKISFSLKRVIHQQKKGEGRRKGSSLQEQALLLESSDGCRKERDSLDGKDPHERLAL